MHCSVQSESESREWKILARFDQQLDELNLGADLSRKALELLARLSLDGATTVTNLLDEGHFDARPIKRSQSMSAQTDRYLARGYIEAPEQSTILEHSSALVSLEIGSRFAVIRIEPTSHDYSRSSNVVFYCSDKNQELTGFQLHHIETTYKLLTSTSARERELGIEMCDRRGPKLPYSPKSGELARGSVPGVQSWFGLEIEYWSPTPDITELLGRAAADEIMSIAGINVVLPTHGSLEQLRNLLDGGREIAAERSSNQQCAADGHWFDTIGCLLFNDGSMRVIVRNSIGCAYGATITPDQVAHAGHPGEVIASMFSSFATSTGDSWMDVVGYLEGLSGQSSVDTELLSVDPQYDNVPPFKDRIGAEMIKESLKVVGFVCATPPNSPHTKATIEYAGLGCARILFQFDSEGPVVEFILKDYALREVTISRPSPSFSKDEARFLPLHHFRSTEISLDSRSFFEVLEETHSYAMAVPLVTLNVFWTHDFPNLIGPLLNVLSTRMERVPLANQSEA